MDGGGHGHGLGPLGQGQQVVLVAVDAAGRDQAHEMEPSARSLELLQQGAHGQVVPEGALVDRCVDAREFLPHHPAGAEVHVADF